MYQLGIGGIKIKIKINYERSVFSAGYFSDFLSARIVESRPMNPNHKRLLNYNSIGITSRWA